MSDRTNKPVHEVRIGAIKAAIWANDTDSGGTRYAVTLARIYRDKDGNWQQTTSFGVDDLPVLQKVADKAFETVLHLQSTPAPGSPESPGSSGSPTPASGDTDDTNGTSSGGTSGGGEAHRGVPSGGKTSPTTTTAKRRK